MAPELALHPRLVAKQLRGLGRRPRHAERAPHLAELDLQRLEDAEHAVDPAVPPLQHPRGGDQLSCVEPVTHGDHVGEQRRVAAARRLLHHAEQPDVTERRGRAREPHRRVEGERRDEHHVAHGPRCNMPAMKVVFLAPSYPPEMQQYTRGLAEVGAEVYGVGDQPAQSLPAQLKRHLHDYLQVPRLLDDDDVVDRVYTWLRGREVDRVLANWEVMVVTAARL